MEIKRYFEMPDGEQFWISGIEYTTAMHDGVMQYSHFFIKPLGIWIRIPSDMVEADQVFIQGQEYWIYKEVQL
jgi:hypothetical protein